MPPNRFESEVESFLEGSHGDRTHIKRADHPRLHHYAGRYSARSPARPCRPRGSLQSGDLSRCFPSLSQPSTPHAIQNSPSTPEPSCKRYKTRPAHTKHPQISHFSQAGRILSRRLFEAHRAGRVSSHSPAPCSRVPIAWPSWQRCKPPNAHTNRLCRIWDGTPMHG